MMDSARKLTDDWKIKKRRSRNKSFKELIDFKIPSPEKKDKSSSKNNNSRLGQKVVSNKTSSVSIKGNKPNNDISSVQLRRSARIKRLSNENNSQKAEVPYQGRLSTSFNENGSDGKNKRNMPVEEGETIGISSNQGDCHDLSEWGLPPSVLEAYNSRNINTMFQWQYECLSVKNVLDGGNLVFSAPTSAGKTLVAEILMLKKVTETRKKAIMILPFVSVVREKVHYFQEMFQSAGIVVDGYMGAHNPPGGFKSVDIAICTIEKANNLINRLMEEKRLDELGILIVDELHMLGDFGRGYLLELLLTKLLYNCKRNDIEIQIVGMSATLPNLDVLSLWLHSELYRTDFRPVPLNEMFKVGSIVYDAKTRLPARDLLAESNLKFPDDSDHTVHLSIETVAAGHGVLIFCPSKNWCENLATTIAKAIYTIGRPNGASNGDTVLKRIGEKLRQHLNGSQLNDIILQLKSSPAGLDSVLGLTVPFGVAFHHAGLTFDERDIVEGAFRQGILKVLVSTTTLSSGVNLPARRVIIRSPLFCGAAIDVLSYKQMVGRAGRKGIDDEGESILLCKESERNVALTLVNSELKPVKSCLLKAGSTSLHSSLKRALIEVIASGVASTQKEVLQYVSCTLLYASLATEGEDESKSANNAVETSIEKCIEYLVDNDIIFKHEEVENEETRISYKPSRLGLAILASGFSPDDALRVLKELQLARRCFVLENDLHLLYEVTPPYLSDQMGALNWMHFLSLWEQLPEEYKRVGELVGVQESFIGLGVQGRLNKNLHKNNHKLGIHQRFYATLALNDLIQEMPLSVVSGKYDCSRGILQSLQQTTSTFAGMLTIFCNRLGWHNLELLFSSFQRRVHFGVQQELCDLIQLSTLNAQRARSLYNAGFETVSSLAGAAPEDLALLLCNMGSFESAKQLEGDLAQEAIQRSEAKRIRITGKQGVNEREAAILIIQEAQYFIKQELGLNTISWKNSAKSATSSKNTKDLNKSSVAETNTGEKSRDASSQSSYPEQVQKMYSREQSLISQKDKTLPLSNDNPVLCDKIVNPLLKDRRNCEKTGLCKEDFNNLSLTNDISLKNTTNSENAIICSRNDKGNETFQIDLEDKFSFFEASVKECTKAVENVNGSVDMVDDLSFSELLLSQTAEGGDVYFAESFIAPANLSCHRVNSNELNACNLGSKTTSNGAVIHHSPDLKSLYTMKASDVSFDLPCLNSTQSNMDRDSIFSESALMHMSGSSSVDLQNSLHYGKNELNQTLKNRQEIDQKHLGDADDDFINSSLQDDPKIKRQLNSLRAHSTPIRSTFHDFVSKPSAAITRQSSANDKNLLGSNGMLLMKANSKQHCGIKRSCSPSPPISGDKEKSINETSGELFNCEDSINEEDNDKKGSKNGSPHNQNVKAPKLDAETSNDLFEEENLDAEKENFNAEKHPPIQYGTRKETCKTTNERKGTLNRYSQVEIQVSNTLNQSSKCVSSNTENLENRTTSLKDTTSGERNANKRNMASLNEREGKSLCLSPENQSQFWKSWKSSEDSLSLSRCAELLQAANSYDKHPCDDAGKCPNVRNEDLTLDSADNSLFDSFDSNFLSPTPPGKTGLSEMSVRKKISLENVSEVSTCAVKSKNTLQNPSKDDGFFENISADKWNSDHLYTNGEVCVKVIEVPDAELEDFLVWLAKMKNFSFSVSCEKVKEKLKSIGPPKSVKNLLSRKNKCTVDPDISVTGLSFCCGKTSFYISISDHVDGGSQSSLPRLEFSEKIDRVKQFFHSSLLCDTVTVHDVKSQYKILWQGCGISLKHKCLDPSIASWLLDPAQGQQSLKMLVNKYWVDAASLMESVDYSRGSLGLQHCSSTTGKHRASTEAYISFHLMDKLSDILKDQQLLCAFTDIEMPSILAIAKMEQNGLGFNTALAVSYQKKLEKKQQEILEESYRMAGRRFNILSVREVSRILFKELKLSPTLSPDSPLSRKHLGVGTPTRSRRLPPELKTNKECLEKIIHLHPLPKAILDWRRLSFATTKVLMPLLRKHKYDTFFCMDRLYSTCYLYTMTGRVNVHSPNLQFVPRDFNVNITGNEEDGDSTEEMYHSSDEDIMQYGVSLRNLFIPNKGSVLLAADYSQLELRILAHLSGDKKLLASLNSDEDVFKKIASHWKEIPLSSVSNEQRQQAKKICYGMIYGISANTLSSQLNTCKEDAFIFMESFKASYPGLTKYFESVIQSCRETGFVTTLMQRRRYLPSIKSSNKAEQSHAERQAINTTIQGSAADLLKAAMIQIELQLCKAFPETSIPFSFQNSSTQCRHSIPNICRGGFLVLQMHDELIYEVCSKDLSIVGKIVQNAMEKTTKLSVKLPVKICTGASWGTMSECTPW